MSDVDVIIVGARCAGAALACYLRRAGASVLLLERSRLPSEHVLSTHTLHPAGVAVVDELGLGAELRRHAPAMRDIRLEKDGALVQVQLAPEQAEYCPRRQRFDGLLQEAARGLGAELRDRVAVDEVIWDGARVAGVRACEAGGAPREIRAGLVVGADGRNSTIAAKVGAEEYLGYDAPRAMYWGYFPAPKGYRPSMDIAYDAGQIRVAFATEDDQVLVGCLPELDAAGAFKAAPLEALRANMSAKPGFAELVQDAPGEPVRGILAARYFLRRAAGPGWALVGDAGLHKEYVSGDGMSEALLSARRLAHAIAEGTDVALERYWHARDANALPRFCFYKDQGAAGPRPAAEPFALARLAREPALLARLAATFEHRLSPYDVPTPSHALRWALAAAVRGRFGLLSGFAAMGRRSAEVRRLVAAAEARAAVSPEARSVATAAWPIAPRPAQGG